MPGIADKVMFEVYRDASYDRQYRVVYFTELDEHNKAAEINRAMAGEHVYDGFLVSSRIRAAKPVIRSWLDRWNAGAPPDPEAFAAALAAFAPSDSTEPSGTSAG